MCEYQPGVAAEVPSLMMLLRRPTFMTQLLPAQSRCPQKARLFSLPLHCLAQRVEVAAGWSGACLFCRCTRRATCTAPWPSRSWCAQVR